MCLYCGGVFVVRMTLSVFSGPEVVRVTVGSVTYFKSSHWTLDTGPVGPNILDNEPSWGWGDTLCHSRSLKSQHSQLFCSICSRVLLLVKAFAAPICYTTLIAPLTSDTLSWPPEVLSYLRLSWHCLETSWRIVTKNLILSDKSGNHALPGLYFQAKTGANDSGLVNRKPSSPQPPQDCCEPVPWCKQVVSAGISGRSGQSGLGQAGTESTEYRERERGLGVEL